MKIKLNLILRDKEAFLRGSYDYAFTLYGHEPYSDDCVNCGEIEIDVDVDTAELVKSVAADIDRGIGELRKAIEVAEQRKAELLALPAPSSSPGGTPAIDEVRQTSGDMVKNTLTGEVTYPTTSHVDDYR